MLTFRGKIVIAMIFITALLLGVASGPYYITGP